MRISRRGILLGLALLMPTALHAQLWYNGDPDDVNGYASESYSLYTPPSIIFESFTVPTGGWTVSSLFGNFITGGLDTDPTQAIWEIRSGVSDGDGGTLLYSGTNTLAWALNGFGFDIYTGYLGTVTGFNPFALAGGTYWMGIAVVHDGPNQVFAATTGGANGIGSSIDGVTYHDAPSFAFAFAETYEDIAYGLDGRLNSAVPEPASMVLLGTGLAGLGLMHLRRRRRA